MSVTQEQLGKVNDILQQLDERLQNPATENRRAPRVAVRLPMTVILLSATAPSPIGVFSRNISQSGLGFVSRRLFSREERIAISLHIPKLPSKLIFARVTFGRYVSAGLYEMGAEFLESVSDPKGEAHIPSHWLTAASQARHSRAEPAPVAK